MSPRGRPPGSSGRPDVEPVPAGELPSALDRIPEIGGRLRQGEPFFFLDYDGTLAPIARRPGLARMPDETRSVVRRLASRVPVAVISGRELEDVREVVGLEGLVYAGSHGLEILRRDGTVERRGDDRLPALEEAEHLLHRRLDPVEGVWIERKALGVAVHYREAPPGTEREVETAVDRALRATAGLSQHAGKAIVELRPDIEWDKGRAVLHLLEIAGAEAGRAAPVYLGDDRTDEDAFRVLGERGTGIVVAEADEGRSTLARYRLKDPARVRTFLRRVADELLEESS